MEVFRDFESFPVIRPKILETGPDVIGVLLLFSTLPLILPVSSIDPSLPLLLDTLRSLLLFSGAA